MQKVDRLPPRVKYVFGKLLALNAAPFLSKHRPSATENENDDGLSDDLPSYWSRQGHVVEKRHRRHASWAIQMHMPPARTQEVASPVTPGTGGSLIAGSGTPPGVVTGALCGSLGSGVVGGGECGCGVGGSSCGGGYCGLSGSVGGSAGGSKGGSSGIGLPGIGVSLACCCMGSSFAGWVCAMVR